MLLLHLKHLQQQFCHLLPYYSITTSTNYYYYALKDVDSGSNKQNLKEDEFFLNYGLLDIDGTYITTEQEIVPALSSWYGETVSKVTKLK